MSLPGYPRYRESGVEWLGEVPEHWEVRQSRRLYRQRKERIRPGDPQLTASQRHGIVSQAEFEKIEGQKVTQVILNPDILKHVEPGDFVMTMRSFQGGLEYSRVRGCISSAYVMLTPTGTLDPEYFRYVFKSRSYIRSLQATTNLVRDGQALRFENFVLVPLPLPPLTEQAAIAEFLHRETAKIDALVAEQRRLIDLLTEKRRAVISHAVTKGLNPDAPMKPSGVDWLGEVPEHWEIVQIKRLVRLSSGDGITATSIEVEGEFPVYGGNGIRGFTDGFTHCGEFAIVGRQGALCGNVTIANGKFWASEHAAVATPRVRFNVSWMASVLEAMNLIRYSLSAAQPGLSLDFIGRLCIAVPPIKEQCQISEFLDGSADNARALQDQAETAIRLLRERRTALISAAVTGKIDVRGVAPAAAGAGELEAV